MIKQAKVFVTFSLKGFLLLLDSVLRQSDFFFFFGKMNKLYYLGFNSIYTYMLTTNANFSKFIIISLF